MLTLEDLLATQLTAAGLPTPVRQLQFDAARKWRLDFAWPTWGLALEVDGATWTRGRHTRGAGVEVDCEKLAEAVLAGYRVMRVTGAMVRSGKACALVARALSGLLEDAA